MSHFSKLDLLAAIYLRFLLFRSPPRLFDRLLRLPFYREVLLEQFQHAGFKKGSRILELGCGPGALGAVIERGLYRLTGCDRSPGMLAMARRRGASSYEHLVEGLGGDLPFGDGVFDGAFCANVFQFFEDPRQVIAELGRVLCPGAPLLIAGPGESFRPQKVEGLVEKRGLRGVERVAARLWARFAKPLDDQALKRLAAEGSFEGASMETQLGGTMMSLRFFRGSCG